MVFGFIVLWFYGFMVLLFYDFVVSGFHGAMGVRQYLILTSSESLFSPPKLPLTGFMVWWFYSLWFHGFMVLWFHGFMVLWFCGFMVLLGNRSKAISDFDLL